MAAVNIVNITSILGGTVTGNVTGSNLDVIDVPADKLYKVNTIQLANGTSGSQTCYVSVSVDNGSNYHYLASNISIPGYSSLMVLTNPIYLDETDLLRISGGTSIDYVISYEIMDDA